MRFYLLTVIFILSGFAANAQDTDSKDKDIFQVISENNSSKGRVTINQDYRIKAMVAKHVEINKKQDGCMGYRLRIYSDKGNLARKKAFEVKTEFMKRYPETESNVAYIAPNFRVEVGNFRTKSEAEKFRREIEGDFPNAFIFKTKIEFPKL
ncbi:MAG: hypothetical protein ABIJ16_13690 [Bacteroidota bacterium]